MTKKNTGELRDLIYEEVLADEQEVIVDIDLHQGVYIPGLLHTCKQTRNEASKSFYSKSHFRIITPQTSMFLPVKWLHSMLPRHRKQLRQVTIHFRTNRSPSSSAFSSPSCHQRPSHRPIQNIFDHQVLNALRMESRYLGDKRRVETSTLLEHLAAMTYLRRRTISFEVDGPSSSSSSSSSGSDSSESGFAHYSTHTWVHELLTRLLERPRVFAWGTLLESYPCCVFLRDRQDRVALLEHL